MFTKKKKSKDKKGLSAMFGQDKAKKPVKGNINTAPSKSFMDKFGK